MRNATVSKARAGPPAPATIASQYRSDFYRECVATSVSGATEIPFCADGLEQHQIIVPLGGVAWMRTWKPAGTKCSMPADLLRCLSFLCRSFLAESIV
jgi:hypothetical protein